MNKDIIKKFRADKDLVVRFEKALEKEEKKFSKVMRDLMEEYIVRSESKQTA